MSLSVSVSVCLDAFAQFSRYRAETLQVGQGGPGTGRGGVKNFGGAPGEGVGGGGGHTQYFNVVKARATPGSPASISIKRIVSVCLSECIRTVFKIPS